MKADLHRIFPVREKCLHVCSVPWRKAGYKVGSDVAFAMDAAASELYSEEDGMYHFREKRRHMQRWMSICGVRTRREVPIHPKHM